MMGTAMVNREDLKDWVLAALVAAGGQASIVQVARHIWITYKGELERSGDLFYTWQYDMRWAATKLRHDGRLAPADRTGVWRLC